MVLVGSSLARFKNRNSMKHYLPHENTLFLLKSSLGRLIDKFEEKAQCDQSSRLSHTTQFNRGAFFKPRQVAAAASDGWLETDELGKFGAPAEDRLLVFCKSVDSADSYIGKSSDETICALCKYF